MRTSHSQRKKELSIRIASSRIDVLDHSDRLLDGVGAIFTRSRHGGSVFSENSAIPAARSGDNGLARKRPIALMYGLGVMLLLAGIWRFIGSVRLGQIVCKCSRYIGVCLKDCWLDFLWPVLRDAFRGDRNSLNQK